MEGSLLSGRGYSKFPGPSVEISSNFSLLSGSEITDIRHDFQGAYKLDLHCTPSYKARHVASYGLGLAFRA